MNNEQMEEIKRYFGVVAEGLGHKIQLVAEGVTNLNEKFDRDMTSLREENEQAHREMRKMKKRERETLLEDLLASTSPDHL